MNLIISLVDTWRVYKTEPIAITHRVTEKIKVDDEEYGNTGIIVPYEG